MAFLNRYTQYHFEDVCPDDLQQTVIDEELMKQYISQTRIIIKPKKTIVAILCTNHVVNDTICPNRLRTGLIAVKLVNQSDKEKLTFLPRTSLNQLYTHPQIRAMTIMGECISSSSAPIII